MSTRQLGYRNGEVIVAVDPETHQVVDVTEVVGLQAIVPQLILVMALAEREVGISDTLAFECRAARAILAEHFPGMTLPEAPDED